MVQRWATADDFLVAFNPDRQVAVTRNLERVYTSQMATLRQAAGLYTMATIVAWLKIQIRDLSEFSGVRDKLSLKQLATVVDVLYGMAADMPVDQVMLFFVRVKQGEYVEFYGTVDPLKITRGFRAYKDELMAEHRRAEVAREQAQRRQASVQAEAEARQWAERLPGGEIDLPTYRLLGCAAMTDDELSRLAAAVAAGSITIDFVGLVRHPEHIAAIKQKIQQTPINTTQT